MQIVSFLIGRFTSYYSRYPLAEFQKLRLNLKSFVAEGSVVDRYYAV
jgi:hypothetical protein